MLVHINLERVNEKIMRVMFWHMGAYASFDFKCILDIF
jgi:hypothetical protein